ncbi:hypothetical protein AGMMS49975_23820 [Clostridia bacterium]|nr:hypothetical protein AGMMS49975_23820 [Clostridia bacterium]
MTNLESKIKEYREMKRLAEEALAAADSIADELKAAMNEAEESKMIIGEYKLSYTDCKRTGIDKKALAADHADIYTAYLEETSYKRFAVV